MSLYHTSMQTIGFAGDLIIPNFFALNNINYAANYKPLPDGYDDEVQSIFANVELGWRSQLYLTLTGSVFILLPICRLIGCTDRNVCSA